MCSIALPSDSSSAQKSMKLRNTYHEKCETELSHGTQSTRGIREEHPLKTCTSHRAAMLLKRSKNNNMRFKHVRKHALTMLFAGVLMPLRKICASAATDDIVCPPIFKDATTAKSIWLVRHAQGDNQPSVPGLPDQFVKDCANGYKKHCKKVVDDPLSKVGYAQCRPTIPKVNEVIQTQIMEQYEDRNFNQDVLIYCSPAARTLETLIIATEQLRDRQDISFRIKFVWGLKSNSNKYGDMNFDIFDERFEPSETDVEDNIENLRERHEKVFSAFAPEDRGKFSCDYSAIQIDLKMGFTDGHTNISNSMRRARAHNKLPLKDDQTVLVRQALTHITESALIFTHSSTILTIHQCMGVGLTREKLKNVETYEISCDNDGVLCEKSARFGGYQKDEVPDLSALKGLKLEDAMLSFYCPRCNKNGRKKSVGRKTAQWIAAVATGFTVGWFAFCGKGSACVACEGTGVLTPRLAEKYRKGLWKETFTGGHWNSDGETDTEAEERSDIHHNIRKGTDSASEGNASITSTEQGRSSTHDEDTNGEVSQTHSELIPDHLQQAPGHRRLVTLEYLLKLCERDSKLQQKIHED